MAAGAICPINANDDNMVVANERDKDNTTVILVSWFQTYSGLAPRRRRAGPTYLFPPQAHNWVLLQEGKEGCRRPPTARRLRKLLR